MVLRSESVGEQDVADQRRAFCYRYEDPWIVAGPGVFFVRRARAWEAGVAPPPLEVGE